ncbi:MAG: amino acid ABC transporter permease, partial [Holosporaceae bacterium]|nr:amino acid ABC transporter permease [Holosporaceae bacterium]
AFAIVGEGVKFTVALSAGAFFIGMLLGILLSIIRYSQLRFLVDKLVNVLRGTPLILQLSLIYFMVPQFLGTHIDVMVSGVIALGINSSAYISEILRGGIESLPKGQFEAAKTLGIPKYDTWKDIILPQVFVNVFPALVNEVISLLKETSIISIIGGTDIMRRSQILAAAQFEYFMPLCVAGVYYYGIVVIITFIGKQIEKRIVHVKY